MTDEKDIKSHWDNIYNSKSENELSWFQEYPKMSMSFIESLDLSKTANIIDIGGGESHFADALLEQHYQNIWVLDISTKAIDKAKKRLGKKASSINWIIGDITAFDIDLKFDLWHDRAAFHFLTEENQIEQYIAQANNKTTSNGYLVLGTFSEQGPQKCSGLRVKQYSESSLSVLFEEGFERISCMQEDHITPGNMSQNFLFCSFKKRQTQPALF
jgi:ubiquinone/menaquinone biosynthesis C-methylase UbiE